MVLMCILLVTQTVACLVSVGELAYFLICTLLVTQSVAYLVSGGELAWFSMYTFLVTLWPVLFQEVSWPYFNLHSSGDTDCGLSCFSK